MGRHLLYEMYERRLAARLDPARMPRHIGVILDGNRRWARATGAATDQGHQAGAAKIAEFLDWSEMAGVELVTLWMLSTDNLQRDPEELEKLLAIITNAVAELAESGRWRIKMVGDLDLLPPEVASQLQQSAYGTQNSTGIQVNVAVGYGGRQEITQAVRNFLLARAEAGETLGEVARTLTVEDITAHVYTSGQPDPDLVIRTSGEQRLSGFLLWQSVHSEFYFCEAYWPDFRRVDFLRALRSYAGRERRHGR